MAVNYKIYQNKREGNTKDMFYARVALGETVTIKTLAQRMQDNCTVKYSDIVAVLAELSGTMKEELQRGNRVKIDGLGTFKIGISTKPAQTAKEFTIANISGTHVNFTPETTVDASTKKRVKSMLTGLKLKEADSYESLKEAEKANDKNE